MFDNQVLQFTALPFGKSMDFHQTDGCNSSSFASTCHLTISVPGRLAYKRSNSKQTRISHNILPSNSSKSKIHSKSKVRFDTSSAIHLYRVGISDTTQHNQSTSRLHRIPTSDSQIISNSDSSFSTNFPFSFGQTQCSSRLHSPRQTSFTTASNVSLICLEISYYSSQSSSSDQQYDLIPFEMVAGHQSTCSGNVHPSSRYRCIPFYGCQSLWMGAHVEPMRLSFHGRWMEDQSQLHINILEIMAIRFALKKAIQYIHHSCVMISTDNTINIYQQIRRASLGGLVGCAVRLETRRLLVQPPTPRGRQHSFMEIDHEIFSTVILSLLLIQEGQLSVSGERMCTILVNPLKD